MLPILMIFYHFFFVCLYIPLKLFQIEMNNRTKAKITNKMACKHARNHEQTIIDRKIRVKIQKYYSDADLK